MDLKTRRLAVAAAYHAGVLVMGVAGIFLGVKLSIQTLFAVAGFLLLAHLVTWQWNPLSGWLQQWLIRGYQCGECGLAMDLQAPWRCGCGFTSGERHAFSPCSQCGTEFAWIDCPGCGVGILV
jgi:hypothetical protein